MQHLEEQLHGIIPIYKEAGWTSHDVVAKVRSLLKQKRVGHTGTLDPAAEGVLLVCLGQATRIADYLQNSPKRYTGSCCLGVATDTDDQMGNITASNELVPIPSAAALAAVVEKFHGTIQQIPPMYSAVKIKGQKLYQLARQNKIIERQPRTVQIYALSLSNARKASLSGQHTSELSSTEFPIFDFDVTCSKGTYIRTLCVDMGRALGYHAHMTRLVRVQNGPFQLEDAFSLAEVSQLIASQRVHEVLASIDEVLGFFPTMIIAPEDEQLVYNGCPILPENGDAVDSEEAIFRVYTESGKFLALYSYCRQEEIFKPKKVFVKVR